MTGYISLYVDNTIPTRTVRCFPKNKSWINSDFSTRKKKKKALRKEDAELLRSAQKQLTIKTGENNEVYRRKLENKLQQNNV